MSPHSPHQKSTPGPGSQSARPFPLGGPVRAVLEGAGVRDVLTKTLGTNNPNNVVRATMTALEELREPSERLRELGRA